MPPLFIVLSAEGRYWKDKAPRPCLGRQWFHRSMLSHAVFSIGMSLIKVSQTDDKCIKVVTLQIVVDALAIGDNLFKQFSVTDFDKATPRLFLYLSEKRRPSIVS